MRVRYEQVWIYPLFKEFTNTDRCIQCHTILCPEDGFIFSCLFTNELGQFLLKTKIAAARHCHHSLSAAALTSPSVWMLYSSTETILASLRLPTASLYYVYISTANQCNYLCLTSHFSTYWLQSYCLLYQAWVACII